jgi:uncharacterized protein (DUF488 family)
MILYTIGFTQKPAEQFFGLLQGNHVARILDIRLHPGGQLSGFAKQGDLAWFLKQLAGIDYVYLPELAPTAEIMKGFQSGKNWDTFEAEYDSVLDQRNIPAALDRSLFDPGPACLLCSEHKPDRCHRRLAAERIAQVWGDVEIRHLIK